MTQIHITPKSGNAKTGPIPVTTTGRETCPSSCPFRGNGCYAESGPLALHWRKVTNGERGGTVSELADFVQSLPEGQLWRHNQAGDLPGKGNVIAVNPLRRIVEANKGKRGFTYTHKPMTSKRNRDAVRDANRDGFTVNLSGNSLAHADVLARLNIGPVVSVVPRDYPEKGETPDGRRVIVCPAQTRDSVTCADCKMCARADRDFVIGFRAHGTGAKRAEAVAG